MRQWTHSMVVALACALGTFGCTPVGGGGGGDDADMTPPDASGTDPGTPEVPDEVAAGLVALTVSMSPTYEPVVGLPRPFAAEGIYDDDSRRDLTAYAVFESSDPTVLAFDGDEHNVARVLAERVSPLTVTATVGEISGQLTIGDACQYPSSAGTIGVGSVIPALEWDLAVRPDGSRGRFSLRDAYCGELGEPAPDVYVFILGALWCGACTHEMNLLAAEAGALREAGGQFVFVAVEDLEYASASTDEAMGQLGRLAGPNPVYMGGDADVGSAFASSGAFSALPSIVIVRTRDMRVIADTRSGAASLDFAEVARDPDAGWEDPPEPMIESRCAAGDEEASEPNNTPGEAALVGAGTHRGGVCDAYPDFYLVDLDGPWRMTIDFEHAVGNLDLYAWDADDDAPLRVDARVIGSYGVEDGEAIEHAGPTVVRIGGFRNESAPYTMTIEAL